MEALLIYMDLCLATLYYKDNIFIMGPLYNVFILGSAAI